MARPKVGETIQVVAGESYNDGLLLRSKDKKPVIIELIDGEWYQTGLESPVDPGIKKYTVLFSPTRTFEVGESFAALRATLEELPHRTTLLHEDGTAYRVWYVDDDTYPTFYPTGGEERKPDPAKSLDLAAKGGTLAVTWLPFDE